MITFNFWTNIVILICIIFAYWFYTNFLTKKTHELINVDMFMKEIYTNLLNNTDKNHNLYNLIWNAKNTVENIEYIESSKGTWVANKGETIGICLRNKNGKLYDDNTIKYVLMHELAHIISPEYIGENHEESPIFMELFKYIIDTSVRTGKYDKINYSKNPIDYCGIVLRDNL